MTYTVIIAVAFLSTIIVLWKPDYLLMILSTGAWVLLWWYYSANPVASIPAGSVGNDVIMITLGVCTFMTPMQTFVRLNTQKGEKRAQMIKDIRKEHPEEYYSESGSTKTMSELSPSEYREVVHRKLHPHRR